jgi:hypothetical protein
MSHGRSIGRDPHAIRSPRQEPARTSRAYFQRVSRPFSGPTTFEAVSVGAVNSSWRTHVSVRADVLEKSLGRGVGSSRDRGDARRTR